MVTKKKTAKKTAKKSVRKPAKKAAKKTAKKAVRKPAEKTVRKPAKRSAKKTETFVRQTGPGQYETRLRYAMADGRPRVMDVKLTYIGRSNGVSRYLASYRDLNGKPASMTYVGDINAAALRLYRSLIVESPHRAAERRAMLRLGRK